MPGLSALLNFWIVNLLKKDSLDVCETTSKPQGFLSLNVMLAQKRSLASLCIMQYPINIVQVDVNIQACYQAQTSFADVSSKSMLPS